MDYKTKAIHLLADGFIDEFIESFECSDKFAELVMSSIDDFIEENIPVRGQVNRTDLAFQMLERVRLTSFKN